MSGNIFNKIQLNRGKRSGFDLSYDHKTSFKMGKLVPIHLQECIPGDKFQHKSECMLRMMPMIAPIMHKVDIYTHYFFVPNRLVWDGWEKFITGGQKGQIPPAYPTLHPDLNVTTSSLGDYMGLPIGDYSNNMVDSPVSAIPFAAYQRIWFDYYRDQNLQNPDDEPPKCTNGQQSSFDTEWLTSLKERAWQHDYFTSCLPFAQKGDAVELPIDLSGDLNVIATNPGDGRTTWQRDTVSGIGQGGDVVTTSGTPPLVGTVVVSGPNKNTYYDPNGTLSVEGDDLSTTTTINDLRTAFSLQKWLEKNARAGTRYVESLLAHFGVKPADARLQRPEYIGGSYASMAISEVLQTSETTDSTPQGTMSGHGIGVSGGKDFSYFVPEHGFIIGIMSVRPKTAYMQGLPRMFSKLDRMEYYWQDFAYLGEQEVKNQELYYDFGGLPSQNRATFGYIPRYSEYRYNSSRVSGEMRSTLDYWHMARKFDNTPVLNHEFITCKPDKRIFAVEAPEEDEIVAHIYHKIYASRLMPKYGNPGGI